MLLEWLNDDLVRSLCEWIGGKDLMVLQQVLCFSTHYVKTMKQYPWSAFSKKVQTYIQTRFINPQTKYAAVVYLLRRGGVTMYEDFTHSAWMEFDEDEIEVPFWFEVARIIPKSMWYGQKWGSYPWLSRHVTTIYVNDDAQPFHLPQTPNLIEMSLGVAFSESWPGVKTLVLIDGYQPGAEAKIWEDVEHIVVVDADECVIDLRLFPNARTLEFSMYQDYSLTFDDTDSVVLKGFTPHPKLERITWESSVELLPKCPYSPSVLLPSLKTIMLPGWAGWGKYALTDQSAVVEEALIDVDDFDPEEGVCCPHLRKLVVMVESGYDLSPFFCRAFVDRFPQLSDWVCKGFEVHELKYMEWPPTVPDWPARLQTITFEVEFASTVSTELDVLPVMIQNVVLSVCDHLQAHYHRGVGEAHFVKLNDRCV